MGDWWTTIKKWTGTCASNTTLKEIKAAVDNSKEKVELAEKTSEFLGEVPNASKKLGEAKEILGKFSDSLGKVDDICHDIKAIGDIHTAIQVLNQDGFIKNEPLASAKAFELIFGGFGRLARHLPPPADEYAPILERLGKGFFTIMSKALNPQLRTINGLDILKNERKIIANPVRIK